MKSVFTVEEYEQKIGSQLKALRLQKNLARKTVCERSGVSMNALRHLEEGQGANLKTLVKVVRALGRDSWFNTVAPLVTVNPINMPKTNQVRQRARRRVVRGER